MKSLIYITICTIVFCQLNILAQPYKDYIGAGHNKGITVTTSSSEVGTSPAKIMDGTGLDAKTYDASRFLGQSTFGVKLTDIETFVGTGNNYEAWIDDQFTKPVQPILPLMNTIWNEILTINPTAFGPWALHFNYAWWQRNMTNNDLLRHRTANALSQLLVVSTNSDLRDWGEALSTYYDILLTESFGNYRDLLGKVSKSVSMGYYLSHLNNPKEDTANNIHPDENYAREIMQLFTIGLYQLNQDGTRVLDGNGDPIPTYDNNDIKELAKVWTGLGGGTANTLCNGWLAFGMNIYCIDKTQPMRMYGAEHQPGNKTFLGHTITGSQNYSDATAMAEVDNAIDFLFNHSNTPPFVAYRLIQRFTTSNPTPAYVGRVAAKFINNGSGVRGDMKAVIKAILMDEEVRTASGYLSETNGKLREPFIKYTHIARSFPIATHRNRYWNNGFSYHQATGQHVMFAPSVFNFYVPDFQPSGAFVDAGLVAPEFKIHNTSTAINYINTAHGWYWSGSEWGGLLGSWEGTDTNRDGAWLDSQQLYPYTTDSEELITYMDKILTHGQLTDESRAAIRESCNKIYWDWDTDWRWYRVQNAMYLIMTSPDYNCVK